MSGDGLPSSSRAHRIWLLVSLAAFWGGVLRQIDLPGVYMDAVNPEYLVGHTLNGSLHNPYWALPTATFPLLGGLYLGTQNYLLGLPFFALFGTSVPSLRIFHALFGTVVVLFTTRCLRALGQRPWVAGLASLALATDPALIASLRTQFAIIVGGGAWMVIALELLLRHGASLADRPRPWLLFLSGTFLGLAVYGYFVLGFFGPAFLLLVLRFHRRHGAPPWAGLARFAGGAAVGLSLYVAGYLSWAVEVGGLRAWWAQLLATAAELQPLRMEPLSERVQDVLGFAHLALSNRGNDLMMFGSSPGVGLADARLVLLGTVVAFGMACRLLRRAPCAGAFWAPPTLAVSYLVVALAFGGRLWAHHFSVLLPVLYLAFGAGLEELSGTLEAAVAEDRGRGTLLALALTLGCVVLGSNLVQQQRLFTRLWTVGGAGKSSDASTLLAGRALRARDASVYVFPEWGFFMTFSFLTGNQVPYELAPDAPRVRQALGAGGRVILAHWTPADRGRYEEALAAQGARHFEWEAVAQRDGTPAFYLLTGWAVP
jgi:hypothetical protein